MRYSFISFAIISITLGVNLASLVKYLSRSRARIPRVNLTKAGSSGISNYGLRARGDWHWGWERAGELADINLLTDVGWTTINFESRCLSSSVYSSGFLLFLASLARTRSATRGRQKFRAKCLHPRARGSRFSLIAFFCTLRQYEVTDCRSET